MSMYKAEREFFRCSFKSVMFRLNQNASVFESCECSKPCSVSCSVTSKEKVYELDVRTSGALTIRSLSICPFWSSERNWF